MEPDAGLDEEIQRARLTGTELANRAPTPTVRDSLIFLAYSIFSLIQEKKVLA
jgi:hypothetical protein